MKISKKIWDRLKTVYQQTNRATQVTSYTKLIESHMVENANVIIFLDESLMSCWWCHNCWFGHSKTPIVHPFIESIPLFIAFFHHHTRKSNQHDFDNLNWQNQTRNNIMIFINSWKRRFKSLFVETWKMSSKDSRNNNTNQSGRNFTWNSKFKYNPNVPCHYCGKKGTLFQIAKVKHEIVPMGCSNPKLLLQFKVHQPLHQCFQLKQFNFSWQWL